MGNKQPVGDKDPKELLKSIDKAKGAKWQKEAEALFEKYDADKSGVLQGAEFKNVLKDLSDHVIKEYEETWAGMDVPWSKEDIKRNIEIDLDSDHDGEITKEEFMKNIKTIVDQID
mmetsp:Transcript_18516/g.41947  ORF Transcript_18516/g.41947 Transcript_18516/m.41947 type:complete len:116 (-) Transcript_18516:89-436(-)